MSQLFETISGTEKLKESRPKINGNFEALRSGFEGNDFPTTPTPVKGQRCFRNGVWYTYGGTEWVAESLLHNHDDRYYSETEINSLLVNKSDTSHLHAPANLDDASLNLAAMQAIVDPYPAGTPSLATSLEGEIQRLRHVLKQITDESYWYVDPSVTLKSLALSIASLQGDMTTLQTEVANEYAPLAQGDKTWFYQNVAPTGYSIVSAASDAVLAVKGGQYGSLGGVKVGTWDQPVHYHAIGDHYHTGTTNTVGAAYGFGDYSVQAVPPHNHTFTTSSAGACNTTSSGTANTWRPLAQVGIICQKN